MAPRHLGTVLAALALVAGVGVMAWVSSREESPLPTTSTPAQPELLAAAEAAEADETEPEQEPTAEAEKWTDEMAEILAMIKSPDPQIRADACKRLARFNNRTATKMIIEAIENTEHHVNALAKDRKTLYRNWEKVKLDWRVITDDMLMRVHKYRAAQRQFAAHYNAWMREMRHRREIVQALGTITDDESIKTLSNKLLTHKSSKGWIVRSTITETFGAIEGDLTLERLIDMADREESGSSYDPRLAVRAIQALAERKEPEAEEALHKAAREAEDWQVRFAAMEAIGGQLDVEVAYPCLSLDVASRNVLFVISASNTMAWRWDPSVSASENATRFDIARAGVKSYLQRVIGEYEQLDDEADFPPFRFNICIYRGYAEFYQSGGMCEIEKKTDLTKLDNALSWLDWEGPAGERMAVGEANLIEALDKCFHLSGFGARLDRKNFEEQPDSMILMMDITSNAGAFSYSGPDPDEPDAKNVAWRKIKEFIGTANAFRKIQINCIGIGSDAREIRTHLAEIARMTGGQYSEHLRSGARGE